MQYTHILLQHWQHMYSSIHHILLAVAQQNLTFCIPKIAKSSKVLLFNIHNWTKATSLYRGEGLIVWWDENRGCLTRSSNRCFSLNPEYLVQREEERECEERRGERQQTMSWYIPVLFISVLQAAATNDSLSIRFPTHTDTHTHTQEQARQTHTTSPSTSTSPLFRSKAFWKNRFVF